jgi:hypothetical protein
VTCLTVVAAVGATLGMALVLRGGSAVIWSKHQDAFPYIKGMLVIFLSWVVSPICSGAPPSRRSCGPYVILQHICTSGHALQFCAQHSQLCKQLPAPLATSRQGLHGYHVAGIVAAVLFMVIRSLILRSPHGYKRAFWVRCCTSLQPCTVCMACCQGWLCSL